MRTLLLRRPIFVWAPVVVLLGACAASPGSKSAPKSTGATSSAASPAASSAAAANPDIVEDTPAYFVQRYPKSSMIRVDEKHIRLPYMNLPVEIYREDEDYYYVRVEKITPEEKVAIAAEKKRKAEEKAARERAELEAAAKKSALVVTPEQFDTLVPPRSSKSLRFVRAGEGLPPHGQWRENIAIADMDGDGHPDIVTSPPRLSGNTFHVFLGDGKGGFRDQKIQVINAKGKTIRTATYPYGGVAVADFDGDGKPDIALASHGDTVRVLLNRGGGKYQLATEIKPSYSSQAIVAMDVDGDGKPDLVVSRDIVSAELRRKTGRDDHQVRVFRNKGGGQFESDENAILGACFSFNLFSLDLSGAGPRDLLTGCRFLGGWGLTWKNDGKGRFANELFENIEQAAYHYAVAAGTFGAEHRTAFADLFIKQMPGIQAGGLNVYFKEGSDWHKVAVWRQKGYNGRLTSVAMGDLDGDGLDDVVFPDRNAGRVRIFFQKKDGTFEESPEDGEPRLDSCAADVRLADLDGDGRLDIVLAKTTFSELGKDPGGLEVLLNRPK